MKERFSGLFLQFKFLPGGVGEMTWSGGQADVGIGWGEVVDCVGGHSYRLLTH
jgi:hypothetical protein